MICNVIDKRTKPYRWKKVNAIIEATWNDNSVSDSDQAARPDDDEYVLYDQRGSLSVSEAIEWAHKEACPVTLYLYDLGGGF